MSHASWHAPCFAAAVGMFGRREASESGASTAIGSATRFTLWFQRHTAVALALSRRSPRRVAVLRVLVAVVLFGLGVALLRRLSTFGDWREAWARSVDVGPPLLVLLALPAVALALIRRLRSLVWLSLGLLLAARIVRRKPEGALHVSTTPARV